MVFFFFNDTATTEIYTLSLHDALPICLHPVAAWVLTRGRQHTLPVLRIDGQTIGDSTAIIAELERRFPEPALYPEDRKSTRLNSSHANISYAVFCLKKKKKYTPT